MTGRANPQQTQQSARMFLMTISRNCPLVPGMGRTCPSFRSMISTARPTTGALAVGRIEDAASLLISETLKGRKMKEKQTQISLWRTHMDLRRKDIIQKKKRAETERLEQNTQSLETDKGFEDSVLSPRTDHERYMSRVERYHRRVLAIWAIRQRTQRLANNTGRNGKIPYVKLFATESQSESVKRPSSMLFLK